MPRWVRASARAVSATGVSAMTSASASIFVSSPVSVDTTAATPSCQPRTTDDDIDRPPAAANRLRSGPSAALWKSPPPTTGAEVMIVTSCPLSARWAAVPRPRQSFRSSRTRTRRPGTAVPSSTSWIENTFAPSTPGSRSTIGSARWNPVAGRSRPGRHDHLVGGLDRDPVGGRLHVEPDLHAERLEAPTEPPEQVRDLAARRLEPGQAELPAQDADHAPTSVTR